MKIITILLILGLALQAVRCKENNDNSIGILECMFEDNTGHCLRTSLARDLDRIELEVTGKKSEPPVSAVVEQAGNIIAEMVDDLRETSGKEIIEEDDTRENTEMARKKGDKGKKKKYMGKMMGMMMLMKAKASLLLQLFSTHLQLKFFGIALLSLLLNAARFWLQLKKNEPAKVIYYEHAQHQHHDHDDHSYWGRSSNETPQEIVYHAYAPK